MPDPASGPTSRPSSETERGSPRISILLSKPRSALTRSFEQEINETQEWFDSPRFAGIVRPYTARQVVEQRGTIGRDYTIAREAAAAFYDRLCELFAERKSITTFGPYSPGQAVAMKRMGIEAIYLGGWATSAKGGTSEDPGPDLASYPLSQVPDEAATLVRALLSADRNQPFLVGVTNLDLPAYKTCYLALLRRFHQLGVAELNGHLLYALSAGEYEA